MLREGYPRAQLLQDLSAGVIVGVVALPLAIAFAVASGVAPAQGLATAVVAGFLISLLGGSRVQIGGPTGAFVVLVAEIVHRHGYAGLQTATVMAGLLLIVMGLVRLGGVIRFIPYPLTIGFTGGIALIIAATQVRDLLGLTMADVPAGFLPRLAAYAHALPTWNPWAAGIGLGTALLVWGWPRLKVKVPGSLVAIVAATAAVTAFGLPVETIGGRFGDVPSSLPAPRLPDLSWGHVRELFPSALAIAMLAGIESLLSAVVADGMTGRRHRSDMEIVAQGVANVAAPLFGGIPATGAIARTATNVRSGGRTPVAGMIHAATLLVLMMVCGRWAKLIPMAALAGILLVVAGNMSEWRYFLKMLRGPRSDVLVMANAFLLTVLVDLTVAIQVGVVLSALLFMKRMADVTRTGYVPALRDDEETDDPDALALRHVPHDVAVFEVDGPFFFGAADKFKTAVNRIDRPPRVLILRLRHVPAIDATALHALEDMCERSARSGTRVILSGVQPGPLATLKRSGIAALVGEGNIVRDIDAALALAGSEDPS
ncbi:MAG TPA: SulP family inorganic anion transporter [Candidatus Krumholzibacteria bacterium]|nr:SulP family inorganic anion transporter [Candidatus Krumholzibacteria bacterium]HRX50613.1 SulP family inorganic anion transporter [Candidatus Krumholzibacteria bacterium]